MTKKINKIFEDGGYVSGNATFQGGPYGFGNEKQLATKLNPATEKIKNYEDSERNKNIEDLNDRSGLHRTPIEKFITLQDDDMKKDEPHRSIDMFVPMPRSPDGSKTNVLVSPQNFIPTEDPRLTDDYLIDDLTEELVEEILNKLLEGSFLDYSTGVYYRETLANSNPKNSKETVGHAAMPTNTKASTIGSGAVLQPKSFMPEDEIAKQNNKNPMNGKPTSDNQNYKELNLNNDEEKENIEPQQLESLINEIMKNL